MNNMKMKKIVIQIISLCIGLFGMYRIFVSDNPSEALFLAITWGSVLGVINFIFAFGRMIASGSIVDKKWKPKMAVEPDVLERMQKTRGILQIILVIIAMCVTIFIALATDLITHGEITLPMSLFG